MIKLVHYSEKLAIEKTIEFCKYPIPRTASDIIRFLKKEVPEFYKKTRTDRAVQEFKKRILSKLVEQGHIVKYLHGDPEFGYARKLVTLYFRNRDKKSPRKLTELYQINFLRMGDEDFFSKFPSIKSVNVEMCALTYRFVSQKKINYFIWKMLNLLWCYSIPGYRSKINIEIEKINFDEKEKEQLLRILDHTDDFKQIYSHFPFSPNLQKAMSFLLEM